MDQLIQWLKSVFGSAANLSAFISALAVSVAVISALVAIIGNRRNQKHYKDSIRPQLSMKLVDYDYMLYLFVKNTGKTAAKNIRIVPTSIENNGSDEMHLGGLFKSSFELYPEETVQSQIADLGSNIAFSAFPKVTLDVSYTEGNQKKTISFTRTVSYHPAYDNKVSAEVKMDTNRIERSLGCISRAAVRTANYLDGHQIAPFDDINLLAGKSLENDLHKTLGQVESPVISREESIKKTFRKGAENNADA